MCISLDKNAAAATALQHSDSMNAAAAEAGRYPTKAIVFDFDGTLTKKRVNGTTWENLWAAIGDTEKTGPRLYAQFHRKEIDYAMWCKLVEAEFQKAGLQKTQLLGIAAQIKLIDGVKETVAFCKKHDIKLYIASGSIDVVIQAVLGEYKADFTGISANKMRFNEHGALQALEPTKYDYEGKARYIAKISTKLQVPPQSILFVGNSFNDQFAVQSGARTLCINASRTNPTDAAIWNHQIKECKNLLEILSFIHVPATANSAAI